MDITVIAEKVALAFRDNRLDWYSEAYMSLMGYYAQAHQQANRELEAVCVYMLDNFPHRPGDLPEFLAFVNRYLETTDRIRAAVKNERVIKAGLRAEEQDND